ncbi:MAG: acyl-CoA dehydrogenase [Tepidisphaeraceae bacterium]|jgi:acyl-CoA dehydrogenase
MPINRQADSDQWLKTAWPAAFSTTTSTEASNLCLAEPAARKLAEFFEAKGLAALKQEDKTEQWYEDFLAYQSKHRLYASVLAPKLSGDSGRQFDLLRYARFLEVFGYFSPAHAYSLQTTFLALFSILMGSNDGLKAQAVAALEAGGLLAFGVSEKKHGSDLFANEFTIQSTGEGQWSATGSKYYIGNANCAAMISVLARKIEAGSGSAPQRRSPFVLFALRPGQSTGITALKKIRTLGVRAAFVGAFDVKDYQFSGTDIAGEGRPAWEAVMGTVTLGKFFLGFGSIGICEHAYDEAVTHMKTRTLYGSPVLAMPHIRFLAAQACARLIAMKLFAYRALDYLHAARAEDRRYLLYCAVQKAKVSTEGVKVMSLLSECVGAKGFESDETYFEMALRDAQLIPLLESSAHINLGLASQFISRYFGRFDPNLCEPPSLTAGEATSVENPYLTTASTTAINSVAFPPFERAFESLADVPNVRLFLAQAKALQRLVQTKDAMANPEARFTLALSSCVATIAYGQLVAENAVLLGVPKEIISAIFHLLVADLSAACLSLASLPAAPAATPAFLSAAVAASQTPAGDWDFVSNRIAAG